MTDQFLERVITCIAKTQHLPVEKVKAESTFEELNIDSLDGINILFALENEFEVNIPDNAAQQVKSVGELAAGLHRLIETGEATPSMKPPTPVTTPPAAAD